MTIPLHKPCRREALPTRFFRDAESKWRAIAQEVSEIHRTGRPVLIGSRTIENSELLARRLQAEGVPFHLLNGKQDRQEADIVAVAGHRGAVTIATNMAGRGTDIRLGPGVAELGGLHVVGVECHESQRIDRQLVGRSGRQGDPGSGRFFVSADDSLICRFGPALQHRMQRMSHDGGELRRDLTRQVAAVQRAAEAAARASVAKCSLSMTGSTTCWRPWETRADPDLPKTRAVSTADPHHPIGRQNRQTRYCLHRSPVTAPTVRTRWHIFLVATLCQADCRCE